jgi:hypothetical protein
MTTPISHRLAIPQKPGFWRDNALALLLGLAFGLTTIGIALLLGWYMFASGTSLPR